MEIKNNKLKKIEFEHESNNITSMMLGNYSEIVGTLNSVKTDGKILEFSFIIEKTVGIPHKDISWGDSRLFIGKKIGILHFDGKYKIREIKEETKNEIF